jgi:hypothetical protein
MAVNLQGYDLPAPMLNAISEIVQALLNSGDLSTPAGLTQSAADLRYLRTVNGIGPDESGNAVVATGGGSALPTLIAPVTAIPLDGNKAFNADIVSSSTSLTIASGQVEGGSCTFVVKGNGSAWGGITGAHKLANSIAFDTAVDHANYIQVWVEGGRVRYANNLSDPVDIVTTPAAPTNTLPTIVTAVAGSALVFTGGSATGSPTPTITYSWRTSGGALVQDNITSGSYTPPAAGSFILRMISTNTQGTDTDDVAVTVSAAATAPGAPTVSNATSITATGLTYTYADPASNGGSAITSRNADISFDGGTTWTAIAAPVVGANTITFASSGSARTAQIRGRATNAVGAGSYGTLTGIAVPAAALPLLTGLFDFYADNGSETATGVYTSGLAGNRLVSRFSNTATPKKAIADCVLDATFTVGTSPNGINAFGAVEFDATENNLIGTPETGLFTATIGVGGGFVQFKAYNRSGTDITVSSAPLTGCVAADVIRVVISRVGTAWAAQASKNGGALSTIGTATQPSLADVKAAVNSPIVSVDGGASITVRGSGFA